MMKVTDQSYQLSILMPTLIMGSLDDFIHNGNGFDVVPPKGFRTNYPKMNLLDISRSALIRFIVTFNGDKYTPEATLIHQQILADNCPRRYYTIRTKSPIILNHHKEIQFRVITAMVYMGIPIRNYFDGDNITI